MSDLSPSVHLSDPEWQLFLRRRREMFEDMVQTLRMGQEFRQYAGLLGGGGLGVSPSLGMAQDVGPTFDQLRLLQRQAGGTYEQQRAQELQMPVDEKEHRKLLGAARFYGIEDAERMPAEQLRREVESHRDYMAERRMTDGGGVLSEIYDTAVQTYVTAGIGAVQGFINSAKHIPFIGDAIENSRTIGEYQLGLDSITEAVTAGMTEEERGAYEQFAVPISRFTGWAAFQGMAGRAVSRTPWIGGISNPFLRGAAYGTVFGIATEGGNDDLSPAQRAGVVATSGLIGGAGEVVLPALLRRLEMWRLRNVMEAPLRPQGMADDIVEAELVNPPLQLSGPPEPPGPAMRQLPPGPRPAGPPPTGGPLLGPSSMPPGVLQIQPGVTSFPRGQVLPVTQGGLLPATNAVSDLVTTNNSGYGWETALSKFRSLGLPESGPPGVSVYPSDDAGGGFAKHLTVAARDQEGNLVGVVLVRNLGSRFDYDTGQWGRVPGGSITDLAVAPHARGQGVATSMYRELEQASGLPVSTFHSAPTEMGRRFRESYISRASAGLPATNAITETRGLGIQFHGARAPISNISEGYYNPANIYGGQDTFYTTDAFDIATGYARGGPVYRVEETAPVSFFNMEVRRPAEEWRGELLPDAANWGIHDDVLDEAIGEAAALTGGTPNLREVMDNVRALSRGFDLSRDEVQGGIFDPIIQRLQAQGYGGMQHVGGLRTGSPEHTVRIYFNPQQQVRLAQAEASSYSKQATLLESPALSEMLRQSQVDDADVALAAVRTNPGQVSVIQNVGDVGKTVRRFLQEFLPNGVGPQDFRVVKRPSAIRLYRGQDRPGRDPGLYFATTLGKARGYALGAPGETGEVLYVDVPAEQAGNLTAAPGSPFTNWERYLTPEQAIGAKPLEQLTLRDPTWAGYESLEQLHARGALDITAVGTPAEIPDRFDILVSDGLPISNKMVKDYEAFGMFSGMKATTAQGQEVIVSKLGPEMSLVRTLGGAEFEVPTAQLAPGKTSQIAPAAPEAYVEMKSFALSRMADEAIRSNLPLEVVDWFGDEFASQLPRYIDEFLDLRGVEGDAARAAYTSLLTELRLQEFRQLEPEIFQRAEEIGREAARRQALSGYSPSVAEVAEPKGLLWEPQPGGGGILRDGPSNEVLFTARSDEEGYAFLQSFQREPLDLSPATTVPVELATSVPGAPSAGLSAGPMFRGRVRELVETGERELAAIEEEILRIEAGGGGGAQPPQPPLLPPGGGGPGGGFERIPTLDWHRLDSRFANALWRVFEPMRGYAARVTEAMHSAGLPREINYWEDVTRIQNSVAVANAEVEPWIRRLHEDALSKIRHRRIRNGTVFQIAQMPWDQALHAMGNAGFTAREVEGMAGLRQLMIDAGQAYGVDMTRFFGEYMPHVRAARSREEAFSILNRYEFRGPSRWFAEEIRNGGLDYLETNAEVLLYKWFRGATYSRHVTPHVERMAAQWANDPRVPERLRVVTANWLSLVTNGFTPGGSRIGEGLASVFQSFGMPIAAADVQRFVRAFMGNTTRAWLGWRPHVVLRETINPLMASIRLGNFSDLAYTMQRYGRDPAFREALFAEAERGGWVLRAPFASAMQDFSSTPVMQGIGLNQPQGPFSEAQLGVRETVARGGDAVRDVMDRLAPQGMGASYLDPLRAVDRVNELGRAIAGFAARRSFLRALRGYNVALQQPGAELNMTPLYAQLLIESGASNLHWPFQRALIERVRAGDFEGAADMFANEGANQLGRMGQLDYPVAMHDAGEWGRVGLHLGNFAHQYQAMMREGLMSSGLAPEFGGTRLSKARAGVRFAGLQALLHASLGQAGATTGWNFGKWMWAGAIMWGGSPLVWALLDEVRGLNATAREMTGQRVSPQEAVAQQSDDLTRIIGASLNPAQGIFSTIGGIGEMAGTDNAMEATANFLVTGQRRDPAAVRYFNDPSNPGSYGMEDPFERRWGVRPPGAAPQGYAPSPPGSGAMP